MQYIVFGAGVTGKKAGLDLGVERVECFASNYLPSEDDNEQRIYTRKIISFSEMEDKAKNGDYIIVIASERYALEMEQQLLENGIKKYFIYHENDPAELWNAYPKHYIYRFPHTLDYAKAMSMSQIRKYKRIAVFGDGRLLPYLISEISFQNQYEHIVGVIPNGNDRDEICTVGIPKCTLDEVWDDIDCLVINSKWNQSDVRSLIDKTPHTFEVIDIYDLDRYEPEYNYPELKQFKDIYKGKRIFVIGNGPSLSCEDLDTLYKNGEICIGANKIYKLFSHTFWRPECLCFIDPIIIAEALEQIDLFDGNIFLADVYHRYSVDMRSLDKVNIVHLGADIIDDYYPNKPGFSDDLTRGTYTNFSVTYFALQIAVYMGAKEIYLLGCDHTIGTTRWDIKHFTDDYYDSKKEYYLKDSAENENWTKVIEMMTKGYEKAEEYSRVHGFRIFNATRGGALEVFERVDFESLFKK